MPKKKNLLNKKFGRLTVIKEHPKRTKHGSVRWVCKCECGKQKTIIGTKLTSGNTQSCGCLSAELASKRQTKDLTGKKFGRLTVIKLSHKKHHNYWECKCDCGNIVKVQACSLKSGNNKSCGCYRKYLNKKRRGKNHPCWKSSLSQKDRDGHRNLDWEKYANWRKQVFKRDKYRCVCCKKKGYLNAHHLNGWNWAINQRYIVSNGVTLCGKRNGCHDTFHKQYGKGNNTKYQFEVFISSYGVSLKDIL